MDLDKKEQDQIWASMMDRRRRLGPDPDDHPSIRRRMELEYQSICLIINWIIAKITTHPDGNFQPVTPGRRLNATHILLVLLIGIGIASITLSWLGYQVQIFNPTFNNHDIKPKDHNSNLDRLNLQNDQIIDLIRENTDLVKKTYVSTAAETLIGKGLSYYVTEVTNTHISVTTNGRTFTLPHNLTKTEAIQLRAAIETATEIKFK